MSSDVTLLAMDLGTTTSSAVAARGRLAERPATGRVEIADLVEVYRSDIVFTPFSGGAIDLDRARALVDRWIAEAGLEGAPIFGGGALITGLAARRQNARELADIVRARVRGAIMAVADDPCLEAWMAFMGGAAALSRARPETPVLNLDVGGGTTNVALGLAGDVVRTGCLFVGARHVALDPATLRVTALSEQARALLAHLGITRGVGDALSRAEIDAIVEFQAGLIEAIVAGRQGAFESPIARQHVQVPWLPPAGGPEPIVTLSGGVAELVYTGLRGLALPPPGYYGDLGVDLAARLLASQRLRARLAVPASMGRATAYGLLRHATQLSGSTLYLPRPEILPLDDLPIVARLDGGAPDEGVRRAVDLARRGPRGGCVEVAFGAGPSAGAVRALGGRIAGALRAGGPSRGRPLVLLVRENAGKALGGYASGWGALDVDLVVIDEVATRGAHFARVGRLHGDVLPVSFHGMTP